MKALGTSISTWHKWDMDTDDQGAQAPHWYADWDTQFPEVIERIAQDGSNSVLIHVNYTLDKKDSTLSETEITPDQENIEDGLQASIDAGLQPILYPTITLPDWGGSQLWDNAAGGPVTIQDPDQWFNDYTDIITTHAVLADKYNLPYLSIECDILVWTSKPIFCKHHRFTCGLYNMGKIITRRVSFKI